MGTVWGKAARNTAGQELSFLVGLTALQVPWETALYCIIPPDASPGPGFLSGIFQQTAQVIQAQPGCRVHGVPGQRLQGGDELRQMPLGPVRAQQETAVHGAANGTVLGPVLRQQGAGLLIPKPVKKLFKPFNRFWYQTNAPSGRESEELPEGAGG